MYGQEQGCRIRNFSSPNIGLCNPNNDPDVVDLSKTANDGSKNNIELVTADKSSTRSNVGSKTVNSISVTITRSLHAFRFTKAELEVLEKEFLQDNHPTLDKRIKIASSIQKKEKQVKNWFKRRLARHNKQRREARRQQCSLSEAPVGDVFQSIYISPTNADQRDREYTPNWLPLFSELYPNSWLKDHIRDPVPGQKDEDRIRDHLFILNYNREININRVEQPPPPSDGIQTGIKDLYNFLDNPGPSTTGHDLDPGQDVKFKNQTFLRMPCKVVNGDEDGLHRQKQLPEGGQTGRDLVNQSISTTRRSPALEQEVEVIARDQPFYTNSYREINNDRDEVQRQQPLSDEMELRRDSHSFPVKPDPHTTMHVPALGHDVEVIVKDQPFVTDSYVREVNYDDDRNSRKQSQPNDRQERREGYHFQTNPGPSTSNRNLTHEQEVEVRDQQYVPSYYVATHDGEGWVVRQQQLTDGKQTGSGLYQLLANPDQSTTRLHSVLGQEFVFRAQPNYYRAVNDEDAFQRQQPLPEGRLPERDRYHSLVNPDHNKVRSDPIPGQAFEIKDEAQWGANWGKNYHFRLGNAPYVGMMPQWYQSLC